MVWLWGRAATPLPIGKTQVCHPWSPHQVGRPPPPAAREVSTALALGSQPGHTFQGPFPLLPPPDALGVWWCLSGLRPNSVLNAGSSSFLTKSWVLLQDSIRRHSLSNMSVSQTGHRKPTEGKGGICTQASSIRGSEEQKPASASGSKILK